MGGVETNHAFIHCLAPNQCFTTWSHMALYGSPRHPKRAKGENCINGHHSVRIDSIRIAHWYDRVEGTERKQD